MNKKSEALKNEYLEVRRQRVQWEVAAKWAKELEVELGCMFLEARKQEFEAMPYQDYLSTPEWNIIRKFALRDANYQCQLCDATGVMLHVHHKRYPRRGEEQPEDLIVLCENCHAKVHGKYPRAVDEYREWVSGKVAG